VITRRAAAWIVAALLGLLLAATVTYAASRLSSQRIGLSGEPTSAGGELVPRAARGTTPPSTSTPTSTARPVDPNEADEGKEIPDHDDD
jgi:hypothetical protein